MSTGAPGLTQPARPLSLVQDASLFEAWIGGVDAGVLDRVAVLVGCCGVPWSWLQLDSPLCDVGAMQ